MIPHYPDSAEIRREFRPLLHPLFQMLADGISEFTFAGLYLFSEIHQYRISQAGEGKYIITGNDSQILGKDHPFFLLPFGLPDISVLSDLFEQYGYLKVASEAMAQELKELGYDLREDRDNFDYLYLREELVALEGPRFHKKKYLLQAFLRNHKAEGKPLLEEYMPHALEVLENWKEERGVEGDYLAAREALERMEELQLCGGIFYVEGKPVAYTLGEEIARGRMFVIHFEKAIRTDVYRGIYQYMNQVFASILRPKYELINREQDLGSPGLRQAKESYNPAGFVRKYAVYGAPERATEFRAVLSDGEMGRAG